MNRIRKNFISFKGRQEPTKGQRVKVYKNLHNGLWSIKDSKTGLVLGHTNEIELANCVFSVGEKTRLKVVEIKSKQIHAYVIGDYVSDSFNASKSAMASNVTYNPFKDKNFTTVESGRKAIIETSDTCNMLAESTIVLINE